MLPGHAVLGAMIRGQEDPDVLSSFAQGQLQVKKKSLTQKALGELMGEHQRAMLATQLRHIDYLEEGIIRLDGEVKKRMIPFKCKPELLDTLPGVVRRTAEQIVAEIGVNMNLIPSAAHLCSWPELAPGKNGLGKPKSGKRLGKSEAAIQFGPDIDCRQQIQGNVPMIAVPSSQRPPRSHIAS